MSAAEERIRSIVDRILRLKTEQDGLAADIREIYAEAKGDGFDKTALGQLVAHLRKIDKHGAAAVEEGSSIFDLYLHSYQGASGTVNATHTHERAESAPERVDMKLVETVVQGLQTETGRKALVSALDVMIDRHEPEPDPDIPESLRRYHPQQETV